MIRPATESDLNKIFNLYTLVSIDISRLKEKTYVDGLEQKGFMLGTDTPDTYKELYDSAVLFTVFEEEGKILGYIIINDKLYKHDDNRTWIDDSEKELIYSNNSLLIWAVAVNPSYSGKGVAKELLKHAENELKKRGVTCLTSCVAISPINNAKSLHFHKKNGFLEAAKGTKPFKYGPYKDYNYILLYKKN